MPPILTLREIADFFDQKAKRFVSIAEAARRERERLQEDFPAWKSGDVRIAFFAHIANNCYSAVFLLMGVTKLLRDGRWLEAQVEAVGSDNLRIIVEESEKAICKNSFLMGWVAMESGLRRIISEVRGAEIDHVFDIYPKCNSFYHSRGIAHPKADEIMELISLASTTRNTVHNDYSYYPRQGGDKTLSYKGTDYHFKVGKQIEFLTWDFVQFVLAEFLAAYEETVRHPAVSAVPEIRSSRSISDD